MPSTFSLPSLQAWPACPFCGQYYGTCTGRTSRLHDELSKIRNRFLQDLVKSKSINDISAESEVTMPGHTIGVDLESVSLEMRAQRSSSVSRGFGSNKGGSSHSAILKLKVGSSPRERDTSGWGAASNVPVIMVTMHEVRG
jgi:hypothetical protein